MRRLFLALLLILPVVGFVYGTSHAAVPDKSSSPQIKGKLLQEDVPEPLRPWIAWVLKGEEEASCPYLQGAEEEYRCTWASKLELAIDEKGGAFSQKWNVYAESWVPLPGDKDHWPQEVKLNGESARVLEEDEKPVLYLKSGQYTVTGNFTWNEQPESFQIPRDTGILQLAFKGRAIPFPKLEENGLIWLQKSEEVSQKENRLEMRVYRKLTDDIPFRLTTQLTLNVSGQMRELVLDKVLLDGFVPMSLVSSIPARLEKDGRLRIQIKPGEWRVEIVARHLEPVDVMGVLGPLKELSFIERGDPWPKEELWVFEARNDLRLVWLEGVPSIDPQQTTLPNIWKKLPAYRLSKGDTLKFVQKRRGDSDPAPDQLTLSREWWLDFDGGGFTIHDDISGTLNRSRRLEANPPLHLGRVSVDGKDQFITKLPEGNKIGIEIGRGRINVSADSRIDKPVRKLSAVGWNHDFQKVSGVFHVPPGWRFFNMTGVDHASDTWIENWTLLDIFLVLIIALAFLKLWGVKWGALALLTLVLTFLEKGAPQWIWLAIVLGCALLRLLSAGKLYSLMKFYKIVTLLLLVIIAIPFMVTQVRIAMYPALEHQHRVMQMKTRADYNAKPKKKALPPPAPQAVMKGGSAGLGAALEDIAVQEEAVVQQLVQPEQRNISKLYSYRQKQNFQQQRPGAKVQTGPGLPRWKWNRVSMEWNGPVEKKQQMRFVLIPPLVNLILAFIRVFLLALLIFCVFDFSRESWKKNRSPRVAAFLIPLLMGTLLTIPNQAQADFPSDKLLEQLQSRLTENSECYPDCFSISRMQLEVDSKSVKARMEISAHDLGAIPLPGSAKEWSPDQVTVDGQFDAGVIRDDKGQLWVPLEPGVHQVTISGPLAEQETIQIPLPLKPHQFEAQVKGWILEGLRDDGKVDNTLQLRRLRTIDSPTSETLSGENNGGLLPFVLVKRELALGLEWEIATRVTRMTPRGVPIVLEVPLLPGESVISPGVRAEGGKVFVNMDANVSELVWRSVLEESGQIDLKASDEISFMEVWEVDVSSVWHAAFEGIPVIHSDTSKAKWVPEWRPWPGEEVTIRISRPEGVPGKTLTIDKSLTEVTPGLRFTKVALSLDLRSSLGGQHVLILPPKSELQSVSINNKVHPIRLEVNKLTLPITPGAQHIKIKWQQSGGIKTFFRSHRIDLGSPSVNSEIHFKMPRNRWTLFVWGPRMGPAVIFWSLLFVIFIFSLGLSRLGWAPLRLHQWFLLGIGITQFPNIPVVATVFVVLWFLLLAWRQKKPDIGNIWFDLRQILLAIYTPLAILALFAAIHQGLLGLPEMQIAGNGSSSQFLRWFQDRSGEILPRPWAFSIPLLYYRIAMLAWALWIAFALMRWLKWGWQCFSEDGLWRAFRVVRKEMPQEAQE